MFLRFSDAVLVCGDSLGVFATTVTGATLRVSRIHSGRVFYAGLLEALTQVMGSAKGYLVDHGPRVALLSAQLGDALGLSRRETSELLFASILSDMGMVGLAEDAWENPVPELPPHVRVRVQQHPLRSEERVGLIPHMGSLATLVRHHHEWWDGRGYPDGLAGGDIQVGAQILRLADTVAALKQERPHRGALGPNDILAVVEEGAGGEFGPDVARAYVTLHQAGDIPEFDHAAFRHAVNRATEHLLPDEVSPLSSEQLLTILANLIDAKDPYTAGHSRRVATLAVAVAGRMGLQDHMKSTLWAGGYLHDLGKLRVPLRILAKAGRLSAEEFKQVQAHPTEGAAILETIPSLRHLTTGARYHHERWDGSGYPEGLRGDRIPLVGQILAVCDSYDAMTSERAYRDSRSHDDAMEEVVRCTGRQFSPRIASAFLGLPGGAFDVARSEGKEVAPPFRHERPAYRSPAARAVSQAARAS